MYTVDAILELFESVASEEEELLLLLITEEVQDCLEEIAITHEEYERAGIEHDYKYELPAANLGYDEDPKAANASADELEAYGEYVAEHTDEQLGLAVGLLMNIGLRLKPLRS